LDDLDNAMLEPTPTTATTPAATVPVVSTPSPEPIAQSDEGRIFASPLARRLAAQSGVDLSTISGRGPNGRILKLDVEQAAKQSPQKADATAAQAPARTGDGYTAIPNSNMRKVIAKRLGESKREVPHFYLSVDCELDALLNLRAQSNAEATDGAYKLSVNDFVIKACALALRDVPEANASWTAEAIHQYDNVDISVAVATPGGLITPIVRNADDKDIVTLSNEVKDLASRARAGKLKPAEFQGGGFSISNLGMFGVKEFSAIINPPQSCILAVGSGEQRAVVKNGELAVATVMTCTLSVDHRSVDGAVGAQFMQAFKKYIEKPLAMLLGR
jgi:pyruvate dehydrogenase E2 component (dihydrolipoamide acetyltransferase)